MFDFCPKGAAALPILECVRSFIVWHPSKCYFVQNSNKVSLHPKTFEATDCCLKTKSREGSAGKQFTCTLFLYVT